MSTDILAMCENKGYLISLHGLSKDGKRFYATYVVKDGRNIFEAFYPSRKAAIDDYHNMQETYFGEVTDKYK